eukprot:CAMPEP_0172193562 /NCGR_PEP_ID=MMETSP1050-20130122/25038_1 /TAXON_ID=233186 /ORGANISM="Cryptomonas curvata, Strain CCAP979/52" /LENGTH=52 /DNA_ID=CAMNT_0012869161 /DNA_START=108 /DNA_END=263 /DNA_ORIENTATION=+
MSQRKRKSRHQDAPPTISDSTAPVALGAVSGEALAPSPGSSDARRAEKRQRR